MWHTATDPRKSATHKWEAVRGRTAHAGEVLALYFSESPKPKTAHEELDLVDRSTNECSNVTTQISYTLPSADLRDEDVPAVVHIIRACHQSTVTHF